MALTVVNSQSQLQARLPQFPTSLPKTQADWQNVLSTLNRWGQILQQQLHAPNVVPTQFQTFTPASSVAVLAGLVAASCTPSIDTGNTYYGAASLKVSGISTGATLYFLGFPISINPATRWFCAFQILAPSGCTGSLTITPSTSAAITETFTVPASSSWQQVWGLFDLSADPDPTATWKFTFTSTATVNLDGMQMNAVGKTLANLPIFSGTQMLLGATAYASNLDGVPDGTTYARTKATGLTSGVVDGSKGGLTAKGSVPPFIFDPGFTYSASTGAMTVSWGAFTVYRMDGTTVSVSAGSLVITSGLSANTTYSFYPYVVDGATTVSFATGYANSFGTPAAAYTPSSGAAAAAAYAQANIPLQTFQFATPSSGTGGGGGNHFGCLHPASMVELANGKWVMAADLQVGDELPSPTVPVRIARIVRRQRSTWRRVRFGKNVLTVTSDHRFLHPDNAEVRATDLKLGDIIAGKSEHHEVTGLYLLREKADMVSIELDAPHLYYIGGALSHNPKP